MLGWWSESVIGVVVDESGGGWTSTDTHKYNTFLQHFITTLSASDMMMSPLQAAFIFPLVQTSSAFSQFVLSLLCLCWLRGTSDKVSERAHCLVRHTNQLRLNGRLAKLTLSCSWRMEQPTRERVSRWDENTMQIRKPFTIALLIGAKGEWVACTAVYRLCFTYRNLSQLAGDKPSVHPRADIEKPQPHSHMHTYGQFRISN